MDDTLFFRELAIHLTREGFTVQKEEDGLLPVELDGAPLCRISKKGAIRFKQEEQDAVRESLIRGKVSDIVRTVSEYTRLMDPALYLKAAGLSEKYKLLADFNGTVLAAQETRFGAQFATWDWNDARTAPSHGNYYPQNYEGAKRDFAVRSGLVDKQRLLSDEQLTEIYRCIHETLDSGYPITAQREKLLRDTAEQIEWAVPDLEERVELSGKYSMKFSKEIQKQLVEVQKDFMPEDTEAGQIQGFLEHYTGNVVCSKQLFKEALGHAFEEPKRWQLHNINEIMNTMVTGWKPFSNPRMFAGYERYKDTLIEGKEPYKLRELTAWLQRHMAETAKYTLIDYL